MRALKPGTPHIRACVCRRAGMRACVRACRRAGGRACICACVRAKVHVYKRASAHACVRALILQVYVHSYFCVAVGYICAWHALSMWEQARRMRSLCSPTWQALLGVRVRTCVCARMCACMTWCNSTWQALSMLSSSSITMHVFLTPGTSVGTCVGGSDGPNVGNCVGDAVGCSVGHACAHA